MVVDPTPYASQHGRKAEGDLDGLAFEFVETMQGYFTVGEADAHRGYELGKRTGCSLRFDVAVRASNLGLFLRRMDHSAELTGTVSLDSLGGPYPISSGVFNLFELDAGSGIRQMVYAFRFTAGDGNTYYFRGHKEVHDDPGALDPLIDLTTLFSVVYRGEDEHSDLYGAGILRFDLKDAPLLLSSMKIHGAASRWQQIAGYAAFTSFAWGALRDEYLRNDRLLYDTEYENLVLSGIIDEEGDHEERPFFFASGVHDRGFPWGDSGSFWDVLLVVANAAGGYDRFCITGLALEGLQLDLTTGSYRYVGRLYRVPDRSTTSYSDMRRRHPDLVECHADIELVFEANAHDAVAVSFPLVPSLARKLSSNLQLQLRELLPCEHPLGIFITPHSVRLLEGRLTIEEQEQSDSPRTRTFAIRPDRTFGEAERGSFRNVKEPTLLYGYLCALRPAVKSARVQIQSRTLRDEKEHWVKDRLDAFLGSIVARTSSSELLLKDGRLEVRGLGEAALPFERAMELKKLGEPILDVRNDQFPTAVLHRRIVEVLDPGGDRCLALEEDMSLLRLEAIGSTQEVVVASMRDPDRCNALDRVLEASHFDEHIDRKLVASSKPRDAFLICIKPNFMFAYDKRDGSTYTDPALVHHLVRRLRNRGYTHVKVVEAQSTYGEYFDRRSVLEMADYLGYDGSAGYEIVDMSLDTTELRHLGPNLGLHPISSTWRDADYRISFAKNKTHAYAYYSLTLKCIYGALPLANKFKEYHCRRGIAESAIEYLQAFPVDFGLIDGFSSADGPFGVFSDPEPRDTQTIIGGANLVAVDWVGASKMGIDPMISAFMRLAVRTFGKPKIELVGDGSPYRPWLNVPATLAQFTNEGVDADYVFGNLMYAAAAQMDETHFTHKNRALYMQILRKLTVPLRRTFFLRTGENPTWSNRLASWIWYQLGF